MPIHYPEFIVGRFDQPGYTIFPALLRPQSQGRIALHSTDPTQPPAIYANYLDQPEDIQTLVEGVKLARRMGQAKAFAPFIEAETHPGPQVQSDQEIADYLRTRVTTIFHPVGSCRMGHDAMAVVDDQLRVYGTDGLRVVDASVMPTTVGGNTNAPTIMVAEKIADMMLHNGNV
jgi:choline dehydrogenase-like flavoprotein